MLVGALDTFVLISVHFPVGFMGNSAIVIPFSPGVRRVIAPPFSERTRALSRFTGVVPKSTLLYVTHVPALLNKVCQPSNVLEGSNKKKIKTYGDMGVLPYIVYFGYSYTAQCRFDFLDSAVCIEE